MPVPSLPVRLVAKSTVRPPARWLALVSPAVYKVGRLLMNNDLPASSISRSPTGRGGKPWKPQDLMGHHFFVVRAIADAADGSETGEQAQDRIAKEFFAAAEDWDA